MPIIDLYAGYEADTGEPSLQTAVKIARLYGVATDYLLGFTISENIFFLIPDRLIIKNKIKIINS